MPDFSLYDVTAPNSTSRSAVMLRFALDYTIYTICVIYFMYSFIVYIKWSFIYTDSTRVKSLSCIKKMIPNDSKGALLLLLYLT